MEVGDLFLQILTVVSDMITALVGMLPNPDPFPAILEEVSLESSDMMVIAYYWLDQFIMADAVITMFGLWFVMFPVAWIIQTLWKWANVR